MTDIRTFRMRLNADDTIAWFNAEWEQFALENGAADLPHIALNRPIWKFMSGSTITQVYQHLFAQVREARKSVTVPFRCDSPSLRRYMEMTISTPDGAELELVSRVLKTEPRRYLEILDPAAPRSEIIFGICAWCKKIRLPSLEWVETETAVKTLSLLEQDPQPGLSHTMCEACLKTYLS